MELANRAGIPPGVINIVTSNIGEIGRELTSNPTVRKLTFTGSTEVGKQLMEERARTVKRTSMELDGDAPFIVFDDADLDTAVAGAMASKFRNAGQTCVCANRFLVQENIHDVFVEKLKDTVAKLRVGIGTDDDVSIGHLINESARNDVMSFISDAVENGVKLITGGGQSAVGTRHSAIVLLSQPS